MQRKAHAHRLRKGRYSEIDRIYLITIACKRRAPRFVELYRGRCFVRALIQVSDWAETLCYVVMPDHVHWLMKLQNNAELSQTVQKVKSCTSRFLGALDKDSPTPLWERSFHDRALRRNEDIRTAARYIVANPLRAGLVESIENYSLWDAIWL